MALSRAAEQGHTKVVKQLLNGDGRKYSMKDSTDWTALLLLAATGEHAEVVTLLLEKDDTEINFEVIDGRTPLTRTATMEIPK